jgi:hypothetical protein
MPARVPLDVDLEDKLLYGLTPMRLAYVVVALLAAFSLWSSHWSQPPIRGLAAGLIMTVGALAAWGRWRGRPVDGWVIDLAVFIVVNHRVALRRPRAASR